MRYKLMVVLLFIVFMPCLAHSRSLNSNMWQVHRDTKFGFRISYPNEWKITPPKGANVRISVSPSLGPGNCNVAVRPVAELRSYSQQQLNQETEAMSLGEAAWADMIGVAQSQIRIIEQRRTKIGGVSALYGEVEAQLDNLTGGFFGKKSVAFMLTPSGGWLITCGVSTYDISAGRKRYEEIRPYLRKIMESFSFVDNP